MSYLAIGRSKPGDGETNGDPVRSMRGCHHDVAHGADLRGETVSITYESGIRTRTGVSTKLPPTRNHRRPNRSDIGPLEIGMRS